MQLKRLAPIVGVIVLLLPVDSFAQASAAPANSSWSFNNFALPPTLPWTTYQQTFIGIPPTEDPTSNAFDVLFYEQVYKTLAGGPGGTSNGGNCYGMSLMSLLMIRDGGHLGFCVPVSQYSGDLTTANAGPTDPMLALAINIMHGHQVNLPSIQFILDIVANHNNRDAAYAVQQFNYWQSRGDYTLVSVTKSLNPQNGGGHTLIAYGLGGPGNQNILVYDPDRPWPTSQTWYTSGQNFIQINGHSWSFNCACDTTTWSGDPGSGGNIIITPISITAPTSPSPASLGGQIIGQLLNTLLLTGAGATIQQVTDDHGKRLFVPGTLDVDASSATGMRNTLLWLPSDQASGSGPEKKWLLFHLGTSGGALHVTVNAAAAGYTLSSFSGKTIVSVAAHGGNGTEVVSLRYPTTRDAGVVLQNKRGTSSYDVQFLRNEIPHQRVNVFTSSNLTATSLGQVEIGLANRALGLSITSRGAPVQYDLALQTVTRKGQDVLKRAATVQEPDTVHVVQPNSWSNLQSGGVLDDVRPSRSVARP
jgi:hypothetical protein